MSELNDLNKLSGNDSSKKSKDYLPKSYADCGVVSKANLEDEKADDYLPMYLGIDKKDPNKYFFSMGPNNPYTMHKTEVVYLIEGLKALLKNNEKIDDAEYAELVVSTKNVIKISDGFEVPKDNNVEHSKILSDLIEGKKEGEDTETEKENSMPKEILSKLKEVAKKLLGKNLSDEDIKELEEQRKDVEKIMESMSPEEKEELQHQMAKEKRDEIYEQAKAFEKELLGDIVAQEDIVYDYDHFVKIYEKDRSVLALKEEMAKLPKGERAAMIAKIVQEFEQKQV